MPRDHDHALHCIDGAVRSDGHGHPSRGVQRILESDAVAGTHAGLERRARTVGQRQTLRYDDGEAALDGASADQQDIVDEFAGVSREVHPVEAPDIADDRRLERQDGSRRRNDPLVLHDEMAVGQRCEAPFMQ